MNKLHKIGATALCGSLACVAANAGDMSVSGSAVATYTSVDKSVTGNPIGINSGITFTGSGELDNGSTFTVSLTNADQSAYSSGNITITVPGIGTFGIDQGAGGQGIDRIDDKLPTAWEETNGTGANSGFRTVSGVGGSTNIELNVDSGMLPEGMGLQLAYTPKAGSSNINDKGVGGVGNNNQGSGWDVVVTHTGLGDGLEVFAGYSDVSQAVTSGDKSDDQISYAAGLTYAMGAITIGLEYSEEDLNDDSVGVYENTMYGVSYAVNDDLSISYGHVESEKDNIGSADVTMETDSVQISYTMGGATIILAETSIDDALYASGTGGDISGTTLRLALAF
jgi:outer membrane protein OmpU